MSLFKDFSSYNCNGTNFGMIEQATINQPCNTHVCPTWSTWNKVTACSLSCGNGTKKINSTCMYNGSLSTLCEGKF